MPAIFKNGKRYSSGPSIPINDGAISNNSSWSSRKTSEEINKIANSLPNDGAGVAGNIVNITVEGTTLICQNVNVEGTTLIL